MKTLIFLSALLSTTAFASDFKCTDPSLDSEFYVLVDFTGNGAQLTLNVPASMPFPGQYSGQCFLADPAHASGGGENVMRCTVETGPRTYILHTEGEGNNFRFTNGTASERKDSGSIEIVPGPAIMFTACEPT